MTRCFGSYALLAVFRQSLVIAGGGNYILLDASQAFLHAANSRTDSSASAGKQPNQSGKHPKLKLQLADWLSVAAASPYPTAPPRKQEQPDLPAQRPNQSLPAPFLTTAVCTQPKRRQVRACLSAASLRGPRLGWLQTAKPEGPWAEGHVFLPTF